MSEPNLPGIGRVDGTSRGVGLVRFIAESIADYHNIGHEDDPDWIATVADDWVTEAEVAAEAVSRFLKDHR